MPKALAKLGPALRVASLRTGRRTGPMANTQSGRVHGAAALPVRSDRERLVALSTSPSPESLENVVARMNERWR
jgi:hypothetical protein